MKSKYSLVGVQRYKSGKIKYYGIKNIATGKVENKTRDEVASMLMKSNNTLGLKSRNGRVVIKGATGKLDRLIERIKGIYLCTGKELEAMTKVVRLDGYNERFVVNDLMDFCKQRCDGRIAVLHGIRRTGKTIAMKHTIARLLESGVSSKDILYVEITAEVPVYELFRIIEKYKWHYVFIDEITMSVELVSNAARLSDVYGNRIKLIVAGKDNLALELAREDNLFDRTYTFRTNRMTFKEFRWLYNKDAENIKDKHRVVAEFIRFGATTYPNSVLVNGEIEHTIDIDIVDNIFYTLKRNEVSSFDELSEINKISYTQLSYLVYKYILSMVCGKSDEQINKTMDRVRDRVPGLIFCPLNTNEENELIINEIEYKQEDAVYKALLDCDILSLVPNMIIGHESKIKDGRYYKVITYCYDIYYNMSEYAMNIDDNKIMENSFENLVLSQCDIEVAKIGNNIDLYEDYHLGFVKYSLDGKDIGIDAIIIHTVNRDFGEIDCYNNLIEIKYTNKIDSSHWKNFGEPSLREMFEGEHKRIIVYNGDTEVVDTEIGKVHYINAYDFMSDIKKWLI